MVVVVDDVAVVVELEEEDGIAYGSVPATQERSWTLRNVVDTKTTTDTKSITMNRCFRSMVTATTVEVLVFVVAVLSS